MKAAPLSKKQEKSLCLLIVFFFVLKSEISFCVIVGNVFHNVFQCVFVFGIFAVFHNGGNEFTKYSSEIFVAGIGNKTSGVRKHSDKITKYAVFAQGLKVFGHAESAVVKPPGAAVLNFARHRALKGIDNAFYQSVIIGVKRVYDGFGQQIVLI